ncbi:MAG: DUF3467 domain-containing protein [Planctomycetes bacterium]|nr:DUF3467 domain-containing protein [Planctomycetota bacterium]
MAKEISLTPAPATPTPGGAPTSDLAPVYANFVSLAGAPEEIVFDFGLNLDMTGQTPDAIKLSHRLVMSYYTAKRLAAALNACLARHEGVFGTVDIDVRHRIATHAGRITPAQ